MNICVYGSASNKIDDKYKLATFELGKVLALRGHHLVFGAGGNGLMGAAARGFVEGKGEALGIVPEFFKENKIDKIILGCTHYPIYQKLIREELGYPVELINTGVTVSNELSEYLKINKEEI